MEESVPTDHQEVKWVYFFRQLYVACVVCLNVIGHGAVIGFSAILMPSLRRPDSHIHATVSQETWIASIVGFALIFGNFIGSAQMDVIGRKKSHLMTMIPISIGWFVLITATQVSHLIIARFLQGLSMGMMGCLGSVIIAEVSDPINRGAFMTAIPLSLSAGVLFVHVISLYLSWQYTALVCVLPGFISFIMCSFGPESPPWLISKGRIKESTDLFYWLRGTGEIQKAELDDMINAQNMIRKSSVAGQTLPFSTRILRNLKYFKTSFTKPEFYKPVAIVSHLFLLYQFSGINVLTSYMIDIISELVGPGINPSLWMIIIDVERMIVNIIGIYPMKKFKRRSVLFTSGFTCIIIYLLKAGYLLGKQHNLLSYDKSWIPILLICGYMFTISIGIVNVTFAISGEVLPLEYRALGSGLSALPLSLGFFIAVKCFPIAMTNIGLPMAYVVYAAISLYCLVFLWFTLPETQGKTLQEIENGFRNVVEKDTSVTHPLKEIKSRRNRKISSVSVGSQILY